MIGEITLLAGEGNGRAHRQCVGDGNIDRALKFILGVIAAREFQIAAKILGGLAGRHQDRAAG